MQCHLCGTHDPSVIFDKIDPATKEEWRYYECSNCHLVFLDPSHHPEKEVEEKLYQYHENSPSDPGYLRFLSQLMDPLLPILPPKRQGLDFGCGPGPAMGELLKGSGHSLDLYDPIFFPNQSIFLKKYDFITCTEVAEHFKSSHRDFETLQNLLRPGGYIGLMTMIFDEPKDVAKSWYHHDPTHVSFYSVDTIRWISKHFDWKVHYFNRRVALIQKGYPREDR